MKKIIIILSLFGAMLIAEEKEQPKRALGFDFHMFPYSFMLDMADNGYYGTANLNPMYGAYISFEGSDGIRFESNISYSKTTTEIDYHDSWDDDYESSHKFTSISIGAFKINKGIDVNTYVGARIGKIWYEYELNSEGNNDSDAEIDNFIISPTFGAEYFISENFSFSGEIVYQIVTEDDTESYSEFDTKTTSTQLIPKFLVRFYF